MERNNIRFLNHFVRTLESAGLTERSFFEGQQLFADTAKKVKVVVKVQNSGVPREFANQGLEDYYITHGTGGSETRSPVRDPFTCFPQGELHVFNIHHFIFAYGRH
jgi:hypothetical protein